MTIKKGEVMKFKIEKNVPLYELRRNRTSFWREIAEALEVGDSVYIDDPPRNKNGHISIASLLSPYFPRKFATRKDGDGARIWRIE